jgi:hypothetical protein
MRPLRQGYLYLTKSPAHHAATCPKVNGEHCLGVLRSLFRTSPLEDAANSESAQSLKENIMDPEEWRSRQQGLALNLMRRAMTAAGIEHCHIDDGRLTEAIEQSRTPGVWVVDEKSAREMINFCDAYDYHEWENRQRANPSTELDLDFLFD